MLPWNERPVEVANLFNPAFCALLIRNTAIEFKKKTGRGIDYPLIFIILPLILHKASREALPSSTITKLHIWLQEHQEVRIGLDQRMFSLSSYTKESIIYGLQFKLLSFNDAGELVPIKQRLQKFEIDDTEASECFKKAGMVGRWFASTGNTATLLSMWSIRL